MTKRCSRLVVATLLCAVALAGCIPVGPLFSLMQLAPVSGPIGPRSIAITFDDGPNPIYTPQVLDILDRYHVKATFFVVGYEAERYPNLVREIVRRGHAVANHSWNHPLLTKLRPAQIDQQISSTDQVIRQITGRVPRCVRPPYGGFNRTVIGRINGSGHAAVIWNAGPQDWQRPGTAAIISRTLRGIRPGAVILLHDGGGNRSQTVAALPAIIDGARSRGLDFVPACIPTDLTLPIPTTTAATTTSVTTTTAT